ncbi:hypothetical protein AVEN_89254-1 [Araneus ventricosus]|uniref:Uncharacterized protein n=1 Tax=Araneus ventricosus TaxID=182803 RepID=A0A4Y2V7W7_ARAVE|nr:hypothetical protein AVEN_39258-1 [Araneus ventricosus]GBO19770.1 hypothetical protein AVEN_89254-1 [Araneus ventricosus]
MESRFPAMQVLWLGRGFYKRLLDLDFLGLGPHAGIVDHLAFGDVAQGAPRRGRSTLHPDKPRRDAVAAFRLTTGHDCLAAHLHRLGIFTGPF